MSAAPYEPAHTTYELRPGPDGIGDIALVRVPDAAHAYAAARVHLDRCRAGQVDIHERTPDGPRYIATVHAGRNRPVR